MIDTFVLAATAADVEALAEGLNLTWALSVIFLIFFMHAGFAMLEAGQVRSKNVANQLTKNLLTWAIGVVVFFLVGMGISNNVGDFLVGYGGSSLSMFGESESAGWVMWLFSAVFAMTAATIVSGAVAGRAKLRAYLTYTFLLAAVIYPVVAGMVWYAPNATAAGSLPFLTDLGFHDFAGGMVVHGVGGIAGLTAAWVLGSRIGRYSDDGSPNVMPGHSMTFAVLGTLILAFGWYGFNVGTAAMVVTEEAGSIALADFAYVGRVVMSTTLGMAMGAVGAGIVALILTDKVDTLYVANGILAGLVGVTGVADVITPVGALSLGLIAGLQLPIVFKAVEKYLKIDDVCAVFPVHGTAGVIGIVLYPLWSTSGTPIGDGLVAGGLLSIEASQFAPQIIGTAIIAVWTIAATAAVWGAFKAIGQARVAPEHEKDGLDISEHGVETYPEFDTNELVTDGGQLRTDGGIESEIQLVSAIVRPDRLNAIKRSLVEIGAPSLTVTNVAGRGSQPAKTGQWRGEEYTVDLHQKVKIEVVVADIPATDVVGAIADAAHTGEPGDGKIFVLPVDDAYQVRTGDSGPEAV